MGQIEDKRRQLSEEIDTLGAEFLQLLEEHSQLFATRENYDRVKEINARHREIFQRQGEIRQEAIRLDDHERERIYPPSVRTLETGLLSALTIGRDRFIVFLERERIRHRLDSDTWVLFDLADEHWLVEFDASGTFKQLISA